MNKFLSIILLFLIHQSFAQKSYTLSEMVGLAKNSSIESKKARNKYQNQYWNYRVYKSDLKPQVGLNADLPNFNRGVQLVPQADGEKEFVYISQATTQANLRVTQYTPLGGQIFVSSQLQRFDNLFSNETFYNSNPAVIGYQQSILGFNQFKWNNKISPLRYEEAERAYHEQMEMVAFQVSDLFFDLLISQISYNIAEINKANNDTLYKISKGRYELGKIAENELLQMRLSVMNAQNDMKRAQLSLLTSHLNLKRFVGLETNDFALIEPQDIPFFKVDESLAIEMATKRRSDILRFDRQKLEVERDLARAKGESGFQADLFASYGLTQTGADISSTYADPINQQGINFGVDIPILDWGKTKARVQSAKSNKELVDLTVEQNKENFEQEIFIQTRSYEMLREQLTLSKVADTVAQKRYDIARKRYLLGKIGITDLNIALRDKDQAKRSYLVSLKSFWNAYFRLRLLTMYDFDKGIEIEYELPY